MHTEKPKKILTVDDDEDIRHNISEMLELEGFEAVWAKNGQVAIDYMMAAPDSELPDLVLLDFMMPVMNGQAFVETKAKLPRLANIPVVMMTASGNLMNVMERVDTGGYMSKPMDITTVVKMVKQTLNMDTTSDEDLQDLG